MFKVAILSIILAIAFPMYGSSIKINSKRMVKVSGTVDNRLLDRANEMSKMSRSKGAIWVIIDSPGGYVSSATKFVDIMRMAQVRGRTVNCLVTGRAASMAFYILTKCDKRYSLKHAQLMFHNITAGVEGTSDIVLRVGNELKMISLPYKRELRKSLCFSKSKFNRYFDTGFLWTAETLNNKCPDFLEIIDNVKGYRGHIFE